MEVSNGQMEASNGMSNDQTSNGLHSNQEQQNSLKNSSETTTNDRGLAVDYIKNKYETTKQPSTHLPTSFREPRKLDVNWDKVVVEEKRPIASTLNVTDLLSCLNVQVNDCKAAFEGGYTEGSSGSSSPLPVNRQVVEKVAPPEITKSVRALFESGQVGKPTGRKAPIVLDIPQESGVYENEPSPCQVEGLVRSADFVENNHVLKGATKDLLNQWNQKGMQDFKSERKHINIREDDGRVLENEPVRRTDVVNSNADYVKDGAEVQKGTTKNLLDQWKVKGTEEFVAQRKAIKIAEDDGKVLESTPVVRTDVVRSESYVPEGSEVQKGTTRNLLDQWKTKGTEEFKSDRKPITIAEDEGRVLENEPVKRTDVVNADYSADMYIPQVEKGMAKNLLNQWKTKGTEEFKSERKPIKIAEDDGRVIENEPTKRTDVVNADYTAEMDLPQVEKGMAKNLLNQWKTKGTEEFKCERKPINIAEDDGRILENEPIKRTDVVNADYSLPNGPEVQSGTTKNLLSQWKIKGTEEFKADRKPINLAEDQGQITENEPTKRTDVVNADFTLVPEGSEVQKGTTKNLLNQWHEKQNEEFKCERKPITIAEDEGRVLENEPVKRTDVVNASEQLITSDMEVQKGTTKNLLNQWKVKGSEEFKAEKRTIVLAEDEGHVVENEPQPQRDDVVRQVYSENTAELPGKGVARNLRDQWSTRKEETKERKAIKLIEGDPNAPSVLENEPMVRTDVAREEDNNEEIWMKKGYTKDLAGFWIAPQGETKPSRDGPIDVCEGVDINAPAVYENNPVRLEGVARATEYEDECLALERGKAKNMATLFQTRKDDHVSKLFNLEAELDPTDRGVYENEPAPPPEGVYKYSDAADDVVGQRGMIKNIAEKFRDDVDTGDSDRKPRDMIEIERAQEGGVYENNPEVRGDVYREESGVEEVISVRATRNMRELWSKKEKEEEVLPKRAPEPVRFTPPRERSPPASEEFKSTHTLTLSPNVGAESSLPAYMTSPLHSPGTAFQQQSPGTSEPNPYQQYNNGYE